MKFWKDRWCGASPFSVAFPSLFALVASKDAWMKDVWSFTKGRGSWSPLFSRSLNDWEMDEVHRFLLGLNGRVFSGMWKMGCFGWRLNVGSSLLSLSTKP